MLRDDLRQNPSNLASVHLGLNLFALSRTGSLSHTRSPKPAHSVPNFRTLESPEWRESACSDHAGANHLSGVVYHPRCQTRASIAGRTDLVQCGRSLRTKLSNTTDELTDAGLPICSDSDFPAPQSNEPFRKQTGSVRVTTPPSSKRLQQTSCQCVCPLQLTVVLSLR